MRDRTIWIFRIIALALLLALVLQPYLDRTFFAPPAPRPIAPRADLTDLERSTISLFQRVSPSVVQVVGVQKGQRNFSQQQGSQEGGQSGTGFIWDGAGHVVTNNHVVEGTGEVAIRLASGEAVRAEILGLAPNYDLAVLRIGGTRLPPPVEVGRSDDLQVGQSAFAIGNPFGLDQSLTTGVISALKRRLPTHEGREIADVIQTDAAINPGNSGGPLLDSAGRLIGVNTAIFSPSGANAGIGFAIPVDVVNRVVPELIKSGRVPTPGIGIVAGDERLAAQLGLEGVVVVQTMPGSSAERAGLRGVDPSAGVIGDIIVEANGRPVRQLSDLTNELEKVGVGNEIDLTVRQDDRTRRIRTLVIDVGRS